MPKRGAKIKATDKRTARFTIQLDSFLDAAQLMLECDVIGKNDVDLPPWNPPENILSETGSDKSLQSPSIHSFL